MAVAASPVLRKDIAPFDCERVHDGPGSAPSSKASGEGRHDPNFMTSLARGLAVIQAFSDRKRHATISQLSGKTGLSRAAVRRCLYTLCRLGFAGCDDHGRFFLRPRVLVLGHSYLSTMPLSTAAQPVLDHLGHLLHESASVATLDDLDIIYVARAHVTRVMPIDLGVGSRLPSFCTSMGRVLLAQKEPDEIEAYLERVTFIRYTERTVNSIEKLRQVLRLVRQSGYCIVDQELEIGLRSMAVPITGANDRAVAALNVGAHAQRVSIQQMQTKFLPHLRAAAQELGTLLR
jgi:IclR family transcriptional regulator, pca regulon regulatory protein